MTETRPARIIRHVAIAVLLYGFVVHVWQLTTWPPYPWAPPWLSAYYVSLTLGDPLAAVLLARRRAALAVVVLLTDAAANLYAAYSLGAGGVAARVTPLPVAALGVALLLRDPGRRRSDRRSARRSGGTPA